MIATHTARAKTSPATVLLADADQGRAPQLRGMLESAGHRVITAADGAATLRMLSAHASDLVLCDAALPDVGRLSAPVGVLAKEGHLDAGEFGQVKRHPVVSEEILGALPRSEPLLPAVRHHHERVDGAGYPDGLGGNDIPLFARIIAIADAFVAMTSDRPYRRRRSRAEAIQTLAQGAGKQWDASLVERFLQLVAETVPETRTAG